MNSFNNEQILSSVPILKTFPFSIHICERVELAGNRNPGKEKIFIVSTPGIFLLMQKAIQRSYQVVSQIAISEISSMKVSKDSITITSSKDEISILHKNYLTFAASIISIKDGLYARNVNNFKIDIAGTEDNNNISKLIKLYESRTIIADRFLGACLNFVDDLNDLSQIVGVYQTLAKSNGNFVFDDENVMSKYIVPLTFAVSLSPEIKKITVDGVKNIGAFMRMFGSLLAGSNSIKKLSMKNIKFNGNCDLFLLNLKYSITKLYFTNCDFNEPSGISLFESFSNYGGKFQLIGFENCIFHSKLFEALFQSLYFNECFHSLETIIFINITVNSKQLIDNLVQLVTCTWVINKKCIQNLCVKNCNIVIDRFLSIIFSINTGILNLDLKGSILSESFDISKINSFYSLSYIDLSNCEFKGDSLLSLFKTLSLKNTKEIGINCSSIKIHSKEKFYHEIECLKIQHLTKLIWENNEINQCFVNFILNHKLVELSLSNSIDNHSFDFLQEIPIIGKLKKLSIALGSDTNAIGSSLYFFLIKLFSYNHIESLNITNQKVGENAINFLLSPDCIYLKELKFDGFSPSTTEMFFKVIENLISNKNITISTWPIRDEKILSSDINIKSKINLIKQKFVAKFGKQSDIESSFDIGKNSLELESKIKSSTQVNETKTKISDNIENMKKFVNYSNDIYDIIKECGNLIGVEPMEKENEINYEKTSIKNLCLELFN